MFHRSRKFCKLFLTRAGTTPNFGPGITSEGTDIWKKIFRQKLHQLIVSGSACGRDRPVRRGWQAAETLGQRGTIFLPRLRRLMRFTPLEIRECTFCVGHEPFLNGVDQTIQGSASDAGCHIQLVRYSDACRYSDKPVEQKGKAKGHSRSTSARARFASVAKGS